MELKSFEYFHRVHSAEVTLWTFHIETRVLLPRTVNNLHFEEMDEGKYILCAMQGTHQLVSVYRWCYEQFIKVFSSVFFITILVLLGKTKIQS